MNFSRVEFAAKIDHTLLKPEARGSQIDAICDEALEHGFATVCVNGVNVRCAAKRITRAASGSGRPGIASVVGFPLGANSADAKAFEAQRALDDGATEIDMVIHIGGLLDGELDLIRHEIATVAKVVHGFSASCQLKVILETALLSDAQIIQGCRACAEGEADYVKTSTGMHASGGATIEHVRLLHKHASPIKVKASGGIRDAASAVAMIEAGADRIGTSSGVAIMAALT